MKQATRYVNRPLSDDPRDTEAWALTEAARRLVDAARAPENSAALQAALQLNQRLWTIFQAAITEPDCTLPRDLRENIAALSLLVDRQTVARLADLDSTKLDTLIQINRSVAAGLAQKVGGPEARAPEPKRLDMPPPEPLRISI
ncbi:flagellar biosynthesis regulator FlaF [Azospirillum sp.]|uniref:flagellar biosynthesis regulator FlaF n=1 Tax=Azospirillum sp. TaxID=34012 RepID=UPI002D274D4E|nr:flagellar biosynthesis regulator FlaF [Azospirillum sp.]HYD70478.1 flagellar biosynthesis regulator FlaF [Azospirillum sp.]